MTLTGVSYIQPLAFLNRTPMTLAERFCQRHNLPLARFESAVFSRSLYPHARLLRYLVVFFYPRFFEIDRELIRGVGTLSSSRDFRIEELTFHDHPQNGRFLRRVLHLRVSTRRVQNMVSSLRTAKTASPFPSATPSSSQASSAKSSPLQSAH